MMDMSRPPRISLPDATYHVFNRFVDKHPFFQRDADYLLFLRIFFDEAEVFGLKIYAWCLMPNHFHLCIETPEPDLSAFLQRFMTRVARELNLRCERSGHLFQGRTRSLLVENQSYFETLIAYILWNPVRAGICADPLIYPWSSAGEMLGASPRLARRELAERMAGRDLGKDPDAWRNAIFQWLAEAAEQREEKEAALRAGKRGQFLSTAEFRKRMLALVERRETVTTVSGKPVETTDRARRFTDRPTAEWTWNAMRTTVARELEKSPSWRTGWRACEIAERDLTVWMAHIAARWSFDRIRAEEGDRFSNSRYSMIVTRMEKDPRRAAMLAGLKGRCQAATSTSSG
jgi:REP element-mobilizing transposase RayT